jgi:hypothetical protein
VRLVGPRYGHPRLDAKYYKAMPHVVLPEYEETLWIDASFRVEDETFANDVFGYLADTGIVFFLYLEWGCIYDEAVFCKDMLKYVGQKVLEQVSHYREQGYPARAGLFAGGVIVRRTHDLKIWWLNELWMQENVRWTYQDQLSLFYLFWKLDIRSSVFRQYLWRNHWGTWEAHAHDR